MASSSIPLEEAESENIALPNWLALPIDITKNILRRLDTVEIVTNVCQVCPLSHNIFKDPLMGRTIHMSRSCGYLENIDIELFCTDDLLEFIAENANNLRCMRLTECLRISDKGFIEAVRKLPQLEEVDISFCNLSKDSLEVLGRSCPLLKSLKFAKRWNEPPGNDDDEAFVIAETMFGLSHLCLKGIDLTSVGLLAILDACPLLESLDIKGCYHPSLIDAASLKKRCLEQIKDLQLPIMNSFGDHYDDGHLSYLCSQIQDNAYVFHHHDSSLDDYFDNEDFYE
ncbi:hypothetical protein TSUD_123670 [Trifolium subterraneum]|uniref:F-box domain-containing protein n=1 Tax=Trifolium subterraneum TaxID=3900 RepID=A0A2Z6P2T6_TRISU|nr:hypothetical protein TSUD_123670 [Trifolium subterraneum]